VLRVAHVLGLMLAAFAAAFVVPIVTSWVYGGSGKSFVIAALVCAVRACCSRPARAPTRAS
jgi:hypothetical protein